MSQPSEPVPTASQIVVLPFVAAVEGYLRRCVGEDVALRVTVHRLLWRHDRGYLQQLCDYLGSVGGGVGRILAVDSVMIGASFTTKKVLRTRKFPDEATLLDDLKADMVATGDTRSPTAVAKSYFTVPFLNKDGDPILILYADSQKFNLFADDEVVADVLSMCEGFTRLLDHLEGRAIPSVRNFPPPPRPEFQRGGTPRYPTFHEVLDLPAPRFDRLTGFHYDLAER